MSGHHHLGILAHSAEGAALCFTAFCSEGMARLGSHMHPDVTVDCIAMGRAMPAWEAGDYDAINGIFAKSIARLAAAGAKFFACPDNTAHIALEAPGAGFAIPGLNIADIVADAAARAGLRRIAILGTKYTMEGPVYPRALGARGLDHRIPEPADRAFINDTIFEELVCGRFTDETRGRYSAIIAKLASEGCDGAALVCTEIPILVPQSASALPILDSTRLLAKAALAVALGDAPFPTWRGGPI